MPKPLSILSGVILGLVSVAYPFLVYLGLTRWNVRYLAAFILAVALLRLSTLRGARAETVRSLLPATAAVGVICLLAMFRREGGYLLYYPVLMNAVLLFTFAHTLYAPPPMIERFARIQEPDLPDAALPYCRKVTLVWCAFFLLNGLAALYTALSTDLKTWTLYNGLISYLLMGMLFAIEFCVRLLVKRKHQTQSP